MLWIIYSLISAFFFGVKDVLAKKEFNKNTKPLDLIFEEYIILILLLLVFFNSKIDFSSFKTIWYLYFIIAIVILCSTGLYFKLLEKHEISLVSPLLNLSPMVLLIFSSIFLFEFITWQQFLGIVLILASTYYLEIIIHFHDKEDVHKHHFNLLKELKSSFFIITLIILVTISLRAVFDKVILRQVNIYTYMFFLSVMIIPMLFIYNLKIKNLGKIWINITTEKDIAIIGIISILSNVFILLAIQIKTAFVSLIVPIRRISTLFSSFVGGMLFHENHLVKKILSIIIMIIGIVLIVI